MTFYAGPGAVGFAGASDDFAGGLGAAHSDHQAVIVECRCLVIDHTFSVPHHHNAVAVVQHFAQEMGDEDHADAAADGAAQEGEQLARGVGIQRRCRLVENDQPQRLVALGKSAGHFYHLPPADGKVLHQIGRPDAVVGENLIQFCQDQGGGFPPPVEALQRGMKDAGIFRHGEIWAQGEFLEDAADAELVGAAGGKILLRNAGNGNGAVVGGKRAGENGHKGGFAGAIVADDTDPFPEADAQMDASQGLDGAEAFFHARKQNHIRRMGHFILAFRTRVASACEYSRLATPPLGIWARAASKLSWVKDR